MKPRSVSPTALAVAKACTSRWYSENVLGGRGFQNPAADLGTACHSALEYYVKFAVMKKAQPATLETLLEFFQMFYLKVFKDSDFVKPQYDEGVQMMKDWFKRNQSWDNFKVISAEQKKTFMVPTSAGEIPCNFIIDRLDSIDDETMRVVDYKSWRSRLYPEDVKNTVQARIYAVAVKIMYPKIKQVIVVYDQLRYTDVGVYFTERDLREAWTFLQREVQLLVELTEADIRETINPECGFCVKKNNCGAFRKHTAAGGIHSLTPQQVLERAAEILDAKKMLDSAYEEIQTLLTSQVGNDEDMELSHTAKNGLQIEARIGNSYSSWVKQNEVRELVGDKVYLRYATLSTSGHKKMLGDPDLTADQVVALEKLKYRANKGEKLNVKTKKV